MALNKPCRFALCQLPHCPWPIPCEILATFENTDKITNSCKTMLDIEIKDITPLTRYILKRHYCASIKRLVVPATAILPYLNSDLENVHNSTDAHDPQESVSYEFHKKTYHRRLLSKLKPKQDVVWIPRDSAKVLSLMFGKIDFIGEPVFSAGQDGQVYAFVIFPNGVDYQAGQHLKEEYPTLNSVVYRIPINELILFSDYIKFTTSVSCSGKFEDNDGAVEIMYNFDEILSETNILEPINMEDRRPNENQDTKDKTNEIVKLLKSSGIKDSGVTAQRSQSTSKSQESELHNKTTKIALSEETAPNQSNKIGANLCSKTQVAKASRKRVKVLGNCCAKHNGFHQIKAVHIKVGDLVVADLTDVDVAAGEVKMICEIGNSLTTYIGCQFAQPLKGPRFYFEHSPSAVYCRDNCTDGILAFIPQELFYGDSRAFKIRTSEPQESEGKLETDKGAHSEVDFSIEACRTWVFASTPIDYFHVHGSGSKVNVEGICGRLNSSYADVSLFAMFAFTDAFDYCLSSPATKGISKEKARVNMAICKIIQYDIVSPLRVKGKVGVEAMTKLRSCLSTYDKQYSDSLLDAEKFILVLLEGAMTNPPFYTFNNGASNFIFEMFVTFHAKMKTTASVQRLLSRSFAEHELKLLNVPNPAFILKLPVKDGKPMFEMVVPNLEIDLKDLLVPLESRTGASKKMLLRAVICLKNNHCTCFARASQGKDAYWAHFDSRLHLESPVVHWIGNLSEMLQEPVFPKYKYPEEDCDTFEYLLRHAYMCIYEPSLEQK